MVKTRKSVSFVEHHIWKPLVLNIGSGLDLVAPPSRIYRLFPLTLSYSTDLFQRTIELRSGTRTTWLSNSSWLVSAAHQLRMGLLLNLACFLTLQDTPIHSNHACKLSCCRHDSDKLLSLGYVWPLYFGDLVPTLAILSTDSTPSTIICRCGWW